MKKYLFALFFAAAVSTASAQNPGDVTPVATESAQVIPVSTNAAAATLVTTTSTAGTACLGNCGAGSCGGGCCTKTKTVCVPEPTTITKTKVLFSSDCETKCHKALCQLLKRGGDCNSCQDGSCGHAYVVHSLYKRVETTKCESFKCVPTQVPVCEAPKCAAPCSTCTKSTCSTGTCSTGTCATSTCATGIGSGATVAISQPASTTPVATFATPVNSTASPVGRPLP